MVSRGKGPGGVLIMGVASKQCIGKTTLAVMYVGSTERERYWQLRN